MMDPINCLENWINKAKIHLFWTNTITRLLHFTWRKMSPCEIVPTTNLNLMIEWDIILQLPNELMDLDFKHQWLLINVFQVLTRHHQPPVKDHTTYNLAKWLNLFLIKPLDPAVSLQKRRRTEEHGELFHEFVISKIQTGKIYRSQSPGSSTDKL